VPPVVCLLGIATAAVALFSTLPAHHWWARIALGGYLVGLVTTLVPAARRWWWVACAVLCGLVPLAVLVVGRARGWHHVAQSEVDVIESAARRLLDHGTPYRDPDAMGARAAHTNYSYFPYLPLLTVPGLPRAILGRHWFTDARCWMVAIDVALGWITWRRVSPRTRAALAAVVASPLVTLLIAAGGHDVFIVSFLLCGAVGAFALVGAAMSFSLLAWPLALPFAFVERFRWRRCLAPIAVLAVSCVPILVDPGAAWANLVEFPAGHTPAVSPADAPSIGHLLGKLPGGQAIDAVLLAAVGLALLWSLVRRPPGTVGEAAGRAAVAFVALAVLVPATRTGYLVHPAVLGVFAWATAIDRSGGRSDVRSLRPRPQPPGPRGRLARAR
jgi:hypothetical protein